MVVGGKKRALASAIKLVIIIRLQIGYQAAILRPVDPQDPQNEAITASHWSGLRNPLKQVQMA